MKICHHSLTILRKKCPYSELFWSTFSRIQIEFQMRENTDHSNSEYGHFSRHASLKYSSSTKLTFLTFFLEQFSNALKDFFSWSISHIHQ